MVTEPSIYFYLSISISPRSLPVLLINRTSQKLALQRYDGEAVQAPERSTKGQKSNMLNLIFGQIAIFCPIISSNTIVRYSSIEKKWQTNRLCYGFQSNGSHFIVFAKRPFFICLPPVS